MIFGIRDKNQDENSIDLKLKAKCLNASIVKPGCCSNFPFMFILYMNYITLLRKKRGIVHSRFVNSREIYSEENSNTIL